MTPAPLRAASFGAPLGLFGLDLVQWSAPTVRFTAVAARALELTVDLAGLECLDMATLHCLAWTLRRDSPNHFANLNALVGTLSNPMWCREDRRATHPLLQIGAGAF